MGHTGGTGVMQRVFRGRVSKTKPSNQRVKEELRQLDIKERGGGHMLIYFIRSAEV